MDQAITAAQVMSYTLDVQQPKGVQQTHVIQQCHNTSDLILYAGGNRVLVDPSKPDVCIIFEPSRPRLEETTTVLDRRGVAHHTLHKQKISMVSC